MTVPSFRAAFVAFLAFLPPAALATPGEVYYIHTDHLDTPREVRDAQNTLVWKNPPLTEPFGLAPPDEDPDGDGESFTLNLRFPGQYYDRETNTHYNYFRDHYFPELGRYGQSDPIGLQGGINTYAYVHSQPLKLVDPEGLAGVATAPVVGLLACMRIPACASALARGCVKIITTASGLFGSYVIFDETINSSACDGQCKNEQKPSPSPALPDDPYSPGETDRRRSEWRRNLGTGNVDPDSPIPDQGPGGDMGGHGARGKTPHETGERNVNSNEEHSKRPKGNPSGHPRR
jgi:RHS repeat-associated protein